MLRRELQRGQHPNDYARTNSCRSRQVTPIGRYGALGSTGEVKLAVGRARRTAGPARHVTSGHLHQRGVRVPHFCFKFVASNDRERDAVTADRCQRGRPKLAFERHGRLQGTHLDGARDRDVLVSTPCRAERERYESEERPDDHSDVRRLAVPPKLSDRTRLQGMTGVQHCARRSAAGVTPGPAGSCRRRTANRCIDSPHIRRGGRPSTSR